MENKGLPEHSATACPYCLHVRSTGASRAACRHAARKAAPSRSPHKAGAHERRDGTRSRGRGGRSRLAPIAYALASLMALAVFATIGGVIGFTYLQGEKAASDSFARARDIQKSNAADAGTESLSREDQEIIGYSAVEYARTKGHPGLVVESIASNGTSATVTLRDPAGVACTVEIVRGGRNHEWLCIGFWAGP